MTWCVYPYRQSIRTRVVAVTGAEPVAWKVVLRDRNDTDESSARRDVINSLIKDAREAAENYLEQSIVIKTLEAAAPSFSALYGFELPYGPVRSIVSVKYTDTDGVEQTLDPTVYDLDAFRGVIDRAWEQSWPSVRAVPNAVRIRYSAGYDEAGISPPLHILPNPIVRAIRLAAGHWDANHEATDDSKLVELPLGFHYLLNPYRVVGV